MLIGKKIVFDKVDGSVEETKELRNTLFSVSNIRGKYPQCFIANLDGSYEFIGGWEEIEGFAESDTLPSDFLISNPDVKTFSKVIKIYCLKNNY